MNINLAKVLDEIEKEKGISKDILIEAIESAISSAYRKNYSSNIDDIKIDISKESGEVKVYTKKTIVQKVLEHLKEVIIDLGRTEALLLPNEQIRNEEYYKGKRIKIYILEVTKTSKGPKILASRTHPELLKRLFELEVPEIHEGLVEIKNIAREAGKRSKVAVYSKDERVDPIGACIGDRGSRIKLITQELKDEKIDVIK